MYGTAQLQDKKMMPTLRAYMLHMSYLQVALKFRVSIAATYMGCYFHHNYIGMYNSRYGSQSFGGMPTTFVMHLKP